MSYNESDVRLDVRDFSRGFLDTPEPDSLPPGATPNAKNAFFSHFGSKVTMTKRPGTRLLVAMAMADEARVDALYDYRRENAAPMLLACCNGQVFYYDDISAFVAVTGFSGFQAPGKVRFLTHKNMVFAMDGYTMRRWTGVTGPPTLAPAVPVGGPAPATAPQLEGVAGTGTPGTFEGFYVWYDSFADHESSPSPLSIQQTYSAVQCRYWIRHDAAPASNYDFWRLYVRRVDTSEVNFYRSITVPIATTESIDCTPDIGRTLIGPKPNENDQPPPFAFMETYKGYGIAFQRQSAIMHVSKRDDLESWHPRDRFPVARDGQEVTTVKRFGTVALIQKTQQTYQISGDISPFVIEPVHSLWGNVSQDAAIEIDGKYYAWDPIRGPYWTDTNTWTPLADGRIQQTIDLINREHVHDIRVAHSPVDNLIVWSVPTESMRRRTLLCYHYLLDSWLPPITGFEYASLTRFRTRDGHVGCYMGDEWGRVYELFTGHVDGPPLNTFLSGTVANASSGTVTIETGPGIPLLYTVGSRLAGMPVAVLSPAGLWQWRRIQTNDDTEITLDIINGAPWSVVPQPGWPILVGGIEWFWYTPSYDVGVPEMKKRAGWLTMQMRTAVPAHELRVDVYVNENQAPSHQLYYQSDVTAPLWGTAVWGVDIWGGGGRTARKQRVARSFFTIQFRFSNYFPNQPMDIVAFIGGADVGKRPRVGGVPTHV